jgi:hypothetical protein
MRRVFTSLSAAALVVVAYHISGQQDGLDAAPGLIVQGPEPPRVLHFRYVLLQVPRDGSLVPILLDVNPANAQIKFDWPPNVAPPAKASAKFKFPNALAPRQPEIEVTTDELGLPGGIFALSGEQLRLFAISFLGEFKGQNLFTRDTPHTNFVSDQIQLTFKGGARDVSNSGPVRIVIEGVAARPRPRVSSGAVQNVDIDANKPDGQQIVATDTTSDITIECDWLLKNAPWLKTKLVMDFRLADGTLVGPLVFEPEDVKLTGNKLVVSKDEFLHALNTIAKDLVTTKKLAKKMTLTPQGMTIVPVDDHAKPPVEGELLPVDAPFKINVAANPPAGAVKADASDIGKASQAAEAAASAAAAAVERGESVAGVLDALNVMVHAYELTQNPIGAGAARAVANAAGAKASPSTSSPQDVADAARTWADAIKAAEGQSVASKSSDATSLVDPGVDLLKDLPPASAKVAFESVLPIGGSPAMSAVGDYEYSLFVATPDRPEKLPPPAPSDSSSSAEQATPDPNRWKQRRIGFFAVKYETPDKPLLAEHAAWIAAWTGAHAVQSQLVSLANPGMGYSALIQRKESLVVGYCSFNDNGLDPRYDWFAFERDPVDPQHWLVYTIKQGHLERRDDTAKGSKPLTPQELDKGEDLVEERDVEKFNDARVPLGYGAQSLSNRPPDPTSPLHRHESANRPGPQGWATIRVVISGDVLTLSIEVGMEVYGSFHLAGQYRRDYFPAPEPGSRSAFDERLQYGAVKLRSATTPSRQILDRAATYGADVLRRRGESLMGPDDLRKERLGDNNHLVLFVHDSRTGQTSWLGLSSGPSNELQVTTKLSQPQGVQRQAIDYSLPTSSGLASPWTPKGEPAQSYPLFLGGEAGSRLVEVWIVQNHRIENHFAGSPMPLFDVQYLFLRPQ